MGSNLQVNITYVMFYSFFFIYNTYLSQFLSHTTGVKTFHKSVIEQKEEPWIDKGKH